MIYRILIMEDDLRLALEWRDVFQLNHYEVTLTHNGDEAIKMLETVHFDLVVTDLFVAKGRGGLSVVGKLIKMGRSAPPVIAVTGMLRENEAGDTNSFLRQARLLGASASIEKPFAAAELIILAEKLIEQ